MEGAAAVPALKGDEYMLRVGYVQVRADDGRRIPTGFAQTVQKRFLSRLCWGSGSVDLRTDCSVLPYTIVHRGSKDTSNPGIWEEFG